MYALYIATSKTNDGFINYKQIDSIIIEKQTSAEGISLPDSLWELQACFTSSKISIQTPMGIQTQYIPLTMKKNLSKLEAQEELDVIELINPQYFLRLNENVVLNSQKITAIKIQKKEIDINSKILQLKNNKQMVYITTVFIGNMPYEYSVTNSHEDALQSINKIEEKREYKIGVIKYDAIEQAKQQLKEEKEKNI